MERVDNLVLFLISVESLGVSVHLVWCWLLACCILPLLYWGMFLVSLLSLRPLSWRDVVFCQKLFCHLMRWSCGFYFSACLYGGLCWQIFVCSTIPASVGLSRLGHGRWWFWCVLGFDLPVFYLVFWCRSFFCLCVAFIGWIKKLPWPFDREELR